MFNGVENRKCFSTSGRVLDPFRSSLTPKIVESLICTQDWIRGSISDTIDYEKDWEENQQIDKGNCLSFIILIIVNLIYFPFNTNII